MNYKGFVILYYVIKVLELFVNGNEVKIVKSWRMFKDNDGEDNDVWDDYFMFFGYDVFWDIFF